jgi:hypothetical protein
MLPSNEINSMNQSHASPCKSTENVAINPEINVIYHECVQSGLREIINALQILVLWHADLLLGSDRDIGNCTVAVLGSSLQTTVEWCFLCSLLSNN